MPKIDLMFKVVVDSPEKLLENDFVRYIHFCERKHNRPEELEILFVKGVLYFSSDSVSAAEVRQYSELIDKMLRQKFFEGKRQDERFNKIKARFGSDGISTGVDMWRWKTRKGEKDGKKND